MTDLVTLHFHRKRILCFIKGRWNLATVDKSVAWKVINCK